MAFVLLLAVVLPDRAHASQLVDRNTASPQLRVNGRGVALVTYRARGRPHRVLYWGGINRTRRMRVDRSGGDRSGKADWRRFRNACGPYRGPDLAFLVDACTAPDGTHWALQEWMRMTPNYGGTHGPRDLRISHFRGPTAYLWIQTDWSWNGRYRHMYGQYVYQGRPVYGYAWTPSGNPLDRLGRNVAVDSWYSDHGPGWRRVNAFLTNAPNGQFCFSFSPNVNTTRTGRSANEWYRASVVGPGVSPDITMMFRGQLGAYDPQLDAQHNYWQGVLSNWATSGPCSRRN